VTFKLATHTKFWSTLLVVTILLFSLGLYFAYMWLSNYALSDYLRGTVSVFFTNGETYFIVIFCCCLVLLIDGSVISVDFNRGGYSSRMRKLVESEREYNRKFF
jgi:phospholipid-transporting ATPase